MVASLRGGADGASISFDSGSPAREEPKLKADGTIVLEGVAFKVSGNFKIGDKTIRIDAQSLKDKWILESAQELVKQIVFELRGKIPGVDGYKNIDKLNVKMNRGLPVAHAILKQVPARAADEGERKAAAAGEADKERNWNLGSSASDAVAQRIGSCFAMAGKAVTHWQEWSEKIERADVENLEENGDDVADDDEYILKPLTEAEQKELKFEKYVHFLTDYKKRINAQGERYEKEVQFCRRGLNAIKENLDEGSSFLEDSSYSRKRQVIDRLLTIYKKQKIKYEAALVWNEGEGENHSKIDEINSKWKNELDQFLVKLKELDTKVAMSEAQKKERRDIPGGGFALDDHEEFAGDAKRNRESFGGNGASMSSPLPGRRRAFSDASDGGFDDASTPLSSLRAVPQPVFSPPPFPASAGSPPPPPLHMDMDPE